MRRRDFWVVLALVILGVGGCDRSHHPVDTEPAKVAENPATAIASRQVEIDPGFGEKKDVSGLMDSAPVKRTAVRDALLVAHAIKCWPQTRDTRLVRGELTTPSEIESTLDRAIGKRRPAMVCTVPPPSDLPTKPVPIGDNMFDDPLTQFIGRLPVYHLLHRAYEQGEVPLDRPPPIMRRKWRSAVRIKPPSDAVMADAIRTVITSKAFVQAVHGLSVTLTDERPNTLIIDNKTMLGCTGGPMSDCPSADVRNGAGWIDGARAPRDDLARRLTDGRRSWFEDGSDFAAAVPIWPSYREAGFTVGSGDTIEAAICAVPDNLMDVQWRRDFPRAAMAMPSYRQQYVIVCLLRILGVSGVTNTMKSYPNFDDRNLNLVTARGPSNDPTVVVGRAPLRLIDAMYR